MADTPRTGTPGLPALRVEPGLPALVARRERRVRRRLWPKLRRLLKAGTARLPFLEQVLAAFYAATDPRTPLRAKATLLGTLIYFIAPIDALPDFIAALGYTDDVSVLMLAVRTLGAHILPEHHDRAREWLAHARAGGTPQEPTGPRVTLSLSWPRILARLARKRQAPDSSPASR